MTAAAAGRADLRLVPRDDWAPTLAENHRSGLPGLLGIELVSVGPGRAEGRLVLREELMLSAGDYLHAGTVVAFADSCAGWGALASLPDGIGGFTTSEPKVNLVGTTRAPDALVCVATMVHGSRTTQVWDANVRRERDGRPVAHFRCTQFLLEEAR
jgi:1,4-dihydroxy-2-naphthoyl-CoA hydrolase